MTTTSKWVPLTVAAHEAGISALKLTRLVKEGRLETRKDIRDERRKLVNLSELRKLLDIS